MRSAAEMRVTAIVNPRAGVAARHALAALEASRRLWGEIAIKVTAGAGDTREWAKAAAGGGADLLLAAGGDGTANEAAWGLLGSETALGLVPVGSGNGLARALGLSLRPARALEQLARGSVRRMDVGFVNDRPFLNNAGAGFDAAVGAAFHEQGKKGGRRGVLSYVRLGLTMALGYRAQRWRLTADAGGYEGRALLVVAMNGRQYGGGAVMAPRACLDDGRLDVVVIEDGSRLGTLVAAPRVFLGTIERFRHYRHFRAASVTLEGESPAEHYRDGEPEPEAQRLTFRVESRALSVLVPPEPAPGLFAGT